MDLSEAAAYLIDPLHEPAPAEETGLNSHFRSTFAPQKSAERINNPPSPPEERSFNRLRKSVNSKDTNPFRRSTDSSKNSTSVHVRPMSAGNGYPTPPQSASPRQTKFPEFSHRQEAFGRLNDGSNSNDAAGARTQRARATSLTERYPGDRSHQPLDILRRDSKRAHRAPHLRKRHMPGADTIDRLDSINGPYHHEGPYDAALLARNISYQSSPIAAVQDTNEEALRATPRENVLDSVTRHRPLDGVALVPPGMKDRFGREYNYREGDNMMIVDGGNYKRWPGVDYHPDDIKGKGEPNFTVDRRLKQHMERMGRGESVEGGIEMTSPTRRHHRNRRSLDQHGAAELAGGREVLGGLEQRPQRSSSMGKQVGEGIRRRLGSLRKKPVAGGQPVTTRQDRSPLE